MYLIIVLYIHDSVLALSFRDSWLKQLLRQLGYNAKKNAADPHLQG
jgi:hypothetical protein